MTRANASDLVASDRQAARERAFWMLAAVVTALFVAFVAIGGLFVWYNSASSWVTHSYQVRSRIADAAQALSAAESAQRGYLLTGDPEFRAQAAQARAATEAAITAVEVLTRDNVRQQERVERLRAEAARRLGIIDDAVRLKAAGQEAQALKTLQRAQGVAAMAQVDRIIADLDRAEARLEEGRAGRARGISTLVLSTLAVFGLLLAALFAKAIRDINLDRAAEAAVAERLRDLVRQRTLLLDEVNHRVKNSLQQIASVVRLQARSASSPEVGASLENTLSRIMAVGRVHEQIYKAGAEFARFDAGLYARSLAQELVEAMGRDDIGLETETEAAELDVRQAGPIALILNELITNALKYGCPPGRPSCIRVRFASEGADYRLTVADDGDGLPADFSTETQKSLGMRAIHALAKQLDGRFVVEHSGRGAAFAVIFPKSDL